ncbi:hypothetical protein N7U66_02725 [Lacinutrix neustonica]|uniref:STAS/SEC14 domain-containing protein n=1 Tax=Lacinutrix neustonica TaxID=2980107 RepID=A0A9E8MY15_9FLAO|nr:hypothetical protein [Lacinutrix neustonica]WAC02622.1 hypothetical protein N7U66_02725 [Lacinutrix neustonica]
MKISLKDSDLVPEILDVFQNEIGTLYFFKSLVVAEINEGIHLNYKTAKALLKAIKLFYKDCSSFGYISNRIHDYSISPIEFGKLLGHFPNLKLYGVVSYSDLNTMNANLEKRFCKVQYENFTDVYSAKTWMTHTLFKKQNSA